MYKPFNKLSQIFGLPKDPVDSHNNKCGIVYKISCSDCNSVYIGQSKDCLHTRLEQHRSACRLLQPEKSALAEHSIKEGHNIDWKNAKVITRQTKWRQRLFAEAVHTHRHYKNALNRCDLYLPAVYKTLF